MIFAPQFIYTKIINISTMTVSFAQLLLLEDQQQQQFQYNQQMTSIAGESSTIAAGMVANLIGSFQRELKTRQMINKMPEQLNESLKGLTSEIIKAGNMPRPIVRKELPMMQDRMPGYKRKETSLISHVPVIHKEELELMQTANTFRPYARNSSTPRYSSASDMPINRTVKIDVASLKANRVIQLRSQQSTAKSYRSVIELQSHINNLRKTFLRSLRQQQKLKRMSNHQTSPKIRKIPKQFTYDYDFNLLESHKDVKSGTIRSPLKPKSISDGHITKKAKSPDLYVQDENNLEEQLSRNPTALPEKQKRVYNNSSRRQVSHFPYISLAENSKLVQNQNVLQGPQLKKQMRTSYEWKQKSHFIPYFQRKSEEPSDNLITQQQEMVFPSTLAESAKRQTHNGSIMKNPRFFKRSLKSQSKDSSKQLSVEYHPLQVTRNHPIDQYYKVKAMNS